MVDSDGEWYQIGVVVDIDDPLVETDPTRGTVSAVDEAADTVTVGKATPCDRHPRGVTA